MDVTKHTAAPEPPAHAPEPTRSEDPLGVVGKVVGGKYEIHDHLGAGGFGEVYEAVNVNLRDQRLVIKFFKRIQAREKFDKEARILCKLDHPNISRVVDYLPEDSAIVIHRIDGEDAETMLWESGPLESELLLSVARTMADAVAYAHSQGIAHRDLKPSNILIDKNRRIYLIDFGIAKEIGGTATKTGRVALTPNFAAPERHAGIHSYNPFLSDIYELGVTLFNLATRSLPYHNPASPALSEWRTNAGRKLDGTFRRVLRKAMHPDPAARYPSAAEMVHDLNRVKRVYARPVRRVFIASLAGVAFIGVLALLGGRLADRRNAATAQGSIGSAIPTVEDPIETPLSTGSTVPATGDPSASVQMEAAPEISPPSEPAEPLPSGSDGEVTGSAAPERTQPRAPARNSRVPTSTRAESKSTRAGERSRPSQVDAGSAAAHAPTHATLTVTPSSPLVHAWVDGRAARVREPIALAPGPHQVAIAHPDFPLFTSTLEVQGGRDATFAYDLEAAFAGRAVARVQLALVPPTDTHLLQLGLNGRAHNFTRFPALDFSVPSGGWLVSMQVQPLNAATDRAPRVDSCLYFADGVRAPAVLRGDSGQLDLRAGRGRLLIFWSQE